MEFNKFDFAKLFDFEVAISQFEKASTAAITYMPEAVRDSVHSVNDATFSLIRTTARGVKEYAETVQAVSKEATAEITKSVEKATKGFKVAA
jgi:predicted outer membrane protein